MENRIGSDNLDANVSQQIAEAVNEFQRHSTGHSPKTVNVTLNDDTLVVAMREALTPAERVLARTVEGAAQVQDFHRQLFASSSQALREVIQRLTGKRVAEAAAETVPSPGATLHAFTSGTVIQVYLLGGELHADGNAPPRVRIAR